MQLWDYRYMMVYKAIGATADGEKLSYWGTPAGHHHRPLDVALYEYGSAGWELCSTTLAGGTRMPDDQDGWAGVVMLYFKRPRREEPLLCSDAHLRDAPE
jgi:hypothetical protein